MQPGAAGQKLAALSEWEKRVGNCVIAVAHYNNN
jgi:hypothetical protein